MASTLKKGTQVSIKKSTLVGEIVRPEVVGDEIHYLVSYTDEGEKHERFFSEDQFVVKGGK